MTAKLDPLYAHLRDHEPLNRIRPPYGLDAWLAVRYDDVRTGYRDARLLRYTQLGSASVLPRYATEDVSLSGGTVPAGEPVIGVLAAANHDPRAFDDPDRLDVTRVPGSPSHLAFGHGAHHCLGAQLARMDLQVALGALLDRTPGLRVAAADEELTWKHGTAIRGLTALPVTW